MILLDMDGVLCNLFGGFLKLFNFPKEKYPKGAYGMEKVIGIPTSEFWKTIEQESNFWLNLEPFPWTQALINLPDTYICTSPTLDPECLKQKIQWMYKHIKPNFRKFFITPHKHFLAKSDVLLIDDLDSNCEKFIQHGGKAYCWPEHWNNVPVNIDPLTDFLNHHEAFKR